MKTFLSVVVLFGVVGSIYGHSYHLGECPIVEPMHGFEMSKFLGRWYVIQKTSTASSCIVNNYTRGEEPGEFLLEQTSQHFALGLTPLKHNYRYEGTLHAMDGIPARMTVKFPLNFAGTAQYVVLTTDYDSYAAVFTCQKLAFAHRQSATLLSRTKYLDKAVSDKLRNKLSSYTIDPFQLSNISQKDCPDPNTKNGVNINIDDDTISAQNAANIVKKVGEKIGYGLEYVATGAKKVYHSLSTDEDSSRRSERLTAPKEETAEWLP